VKTESSKWIKREISQSAFGWQDGHGIFNVSASGLEKARSYVLNQEEHHRTIIFQEETRAPDSASYDFPFENLVISLTGNSPDIKYRYKSGHIQRGRL